PFPASRALIRLGFVDPESADVLLASSLVIIEVSALVIAIHLDSWHVASLSLVMVLCFVFIALQLVGTWLIGPMKWYEALAIIGFLIFFSLEIDIAYSYLTCAGLALAAAGAAMLGNVYSILATIVVVLIYAMIGLAFNARPPMTEPIEIATEFLDQRIRRW